MKQPPLTCPHCNFKLDEGNIYDKFIELGNAPLRAKELAYNYGWTPDNDLRFSKIISRYQYKDYENRVMIFYCPSCSKEIDLS